MGEWAAQVGQRGPTQILPLSLCTKSPPPHAHTPRAFAFCLSSPLGLWRAAGRASHWDCSRHMLWAPETCPPPPAPPRGHPEVPPLPLPHLPQQGSPGAGKGGLCQTVTCATRGPGWSCPPHASFFSSGPEGGRPAQEAAALHRALQVAAQLAQPLLCLRSLHPLRAHQPGGGWAASALLSSDALSGDPWPPAPLFSRKPPEPPARAGGSLPSQAKGGAMHGGHA